MCRIKVLKRIKTIVETREAHNKFFEQGREARNNICHTREACNKVRCTQGVEKEPIQ